MKYHKIHSIYKRTNGGELLIGEYSLPEFELLKNVKWNFTEKIDGTNIRIHWDGEVFSFKGRTDNASIPSFLYDKLQSIFLNDRMLNKFKEQFAPENPGDKVNVTLYGEGYGAKIQKSGGNYKKDGVDFILFDVNIEKVWLKRESVDDIAGEFGLRSVPVVFTGTLNQAESFVKQGVNSVFGNFVSEGVVGVPEVELLSRMGKRIVIKIKNKDY